MPTMKELEASSKAYADARASLAQLVAELEEARRAFLAANAPKVRRKLQRVAELEAQLKQDIDASRHLFVKPRTVVLHGIKVGLEKGTGKIVFDDPDQVVALIDKKLPDMADVLTITERKPNRKALAQLTVQQLRSVGATVEEAGDRVVVRAVDGDVDKLVMALLRGANDMEVPETTATT
jgi:hypothetical protein